MSKIYETAPIQIAVAGQPVWLAIPFPSRTTINKIIVAQVAGTLENFAVELFNNSEVTTATAATFTPPTPPALPLAEELWRICPVLNSDRPGLLSKIGDEFVFYSHEDQVGLPTVNARIVYMRITPAGTSAKTFSVLLGCKSDM